MTKKKIKKKKIRKGRVRQGRIQELIYLSFERLKRILRKLLLLIINNIFLKDEVCNEDGYFQVPKFLEDEEIQL